MTQFDEIGDIEMRTIFLIAFFVSTIFGSVALAEGECQYGLSTSGNVVNINIDSSTTEYSCSVSWGDGSGFVGPNSSAGQYSYTHGYSYTPGGVTEYTVTVNGASHKVVIDDTSGSGVVTSSGAGSNGPQVTTWCAVEPGTVSIVLTDNYLVGSLKIMGGQKDAFVVDFGEGEPFVPYANFDGVIVFDHYYTMGEDMVFPATVSNRMTGATCVTFTVTVEGDKVTMS